MQSLTEQRVRGLLLLLILGAFALRCYELTRQDIWWDEARNIDVALRPFWQIPTAPELDIHPPLYFWLLHLWCRLLGLGDSTEMSVALLASPAQLTFITRSLSVFFGLLGMATSIGLARQWQRKSEEVAGSSHYGLILFGVACLAALSPFWLAESQETRMYTLSFFWLMAAAFALLRGLSHGAPRLLFFFAILAALALLTHYNSLFIVLSWYLWWGLWALLQPRRWLWMRCVIGTGLFMSLLILPVLPIALRQIPGYRNPNLSVPPISEYLADNWRAYFGGTAFSPGLVSLGEWPLGNGWLWTVAVLIALGLCIHFWQRSRGNSEEITYLSFYLVWLLGGLGLYYIAVVDRGAFNPRYSSFVTPALYLLASIGLSAWGYRSIGVATGAFLLIGIGLGPAISADLYEERFSREAMQQTVTWLREEITPNDVVFVDQKYPFGFYYQRFAIEPEQIPIGQEVAPARYLFVDINTIDQRLNQWAADAERIFWVQWYESDTDPRHAVSFLLDKTGTWSGKKAFRGYTVEWWSLEPPNRYVLAPNMVAATYIFPPAVETTELSLPQEPSNPGELLPVAIRWKRVTVGEIDRPLKARVAIYPLGSESRKAQSDRPLLNDRHLLPAEWDPNDTPINVYSVTLPEDLARGSYEVRLLVYDAETLDPLTYVDLAGNPAGIEAVIGTVTVE
ncbi:MAG: hypothetical protein AAF702_32640 [Chloroflexota bacterium]